MSIRAPYALLREMLVQLKGCSDAGNWEAAAQIATRIAAQVEAKDFPAATTQDQALIEACLAEIAAITEKAAPLHADIGRLLRAFGPADGDDLRRAAVL
ncbi:MAG: hypothetical protein LBO00_00840 [Zoogloeaceae bacterium]|jgi:hypothetical protein|nr:hypothetical protein [Zoogloeaceae bacterium]